MGEGGFHGFDSGAERLSGGVRGDGTGNATHRLRRRSRRLANVCRLRVHSPCARRALSPNSSGLP
jgi:hypothetical protein